MPFSATQMDLDIIILNDVLQKFHLLILVCETLKKKTRQMNLFTKQKETDSYRKQSYSYQKGRMWGRNKPGAWDEHIHTTMHKTDKGQQGPYYTAQ